MSLLVDQLNTINTSLDTLTERGGVGVDAGPLAGDSVANYLKNQLRTMISAGIDGFDNNSIYLAYFGLKTEQDGSFTLDIDTFKDYYEENQDQFSALFNSRVTTSSNLVTAKMLSEDYTPGVYSFILADNGVGTIGDTTLLNSGNSYTATSGAVSGLFQLQHLRERMILVFILAAHLSIPYLLLQLLYYRIQEILMRS